MLGGGMETKRSSWGWKSSKKQGLGLNRTIGLVASAFGGAPVGQRLREETPKWWAPPLAVSERADAFDSMHTARSRALEQVHDLVQRNAAALSAGGGTASVVAFERALFDVRRSRYVTPPYLAVLQANAASGDGGGAATGGRTRTFRQQQEQLLAALERGETAIPGLGLLSPSAAASLASSLATGLKGNAGYGDEWWDDEEYGEEDGDEWWPDGDGEGADSDGRTDGAHQEGASHGAAGKGAGAASHLGTGTQDGQAHGKGQGKGKGGGRGGGRGGRGRGRGRGARRDQSGASTDDEGDDTEGGGRGRGKRRGQPPQKPKFDPLGKGSIWAPRAKEADARSLYDTEEVEFKRFKHDWNRVLELGIGKLIVRMDDDGDLDVNDDGVADEIEESMEVMWEYHGLLYTIFAFYAATADETQYIYLNQWSQFINDCGLASNKSKFCKKSDMDRLFIAVDTKASMVAAAQKKEAEAMRMRKPPRSSSPTSWTGSSPSPHGARSSSPSPDGRTSPDQDRPGSPVQVVAVQATQVVADFKKKALSRVEFLACIVHVAVNKASARARATTTATRQRACTCDARELPQTCPRAKGPFPSAHVPLCLFPIVHTQRSSFRLRPSAFPTRAPVGCACVHLSLRHARARRSTSCPRRSRT